MNGRVTGLLVAAIALCAAACGGVESQALSAEIEPTRAALPTSIAALTTRGGTNRDTAAADYALADDTDHFVYLEAHSERAGDLLTVWGRFDVPDGAAVVVRVGRVVYAAPVTEDEIAHANGITRYPRVMDGRFETDAINVSHLADGYDFKLHALFTFAGQPQHVIEFFDGGRLLDGPQVRGSGNLRFITASVDVE